MAKIINHEHAGLVKQTPWQRSPAPDPSTQLACTAIHTNSCTCWSQPIMLTKPTISFSHLLLDIEGSCPLMSCLHCTSQEAGPCQKPCIPRLAHGPLLTPLGTLPLAKDREEKSPSRSSPNSSPTRARELQPGGLLSEMMHVLLSRAGVWGQRLRNLPPLVSQRKELPLDLLQHKHNWD